MRHRSRSPRRRLTSAAAALATFAAIGLMLQPAAADDRDLLRFDSAKPYLFIVLDTSSSMAMRMGRDEWAPGGADSPDSRIFQAKQALYNVLRDVDDVHFGFVSFNQDGARAVAKHWLYYNDTPLPSASDWPIQFPRPDLWDVGSDGSALTRIRSIPRVDADGNPIAGGTRTPDTRVTEIGNVDPVTGAVLADADLMTFGPALETPTPDSLGRVIAGTCGSPLDLAVPQQRDAVESLAVFPSGTNPTRVWLRNGNGPTYLLAVTRPGKRPDDSNNALLGQDRLHVILELKKVAPGNNSCGTVDTAAFDASFGNGGPTRTLRLDLRLDPYLNQFFHVNHHTWMPGKGAESTAPGWLGKDVISATDFEDNPHTGFGWEGNYDSGVITGDAAFDQVLVDSGFHEADFHCEPGTDCATANVKPRVETTVSQAHLGRAFDSGDMLPFDWNEPHREELLRHLDPEYDPDFTTLGDFRVARHFGNSTIATPGGPALPLVDGHRPLVAADLSPLARVLTDIRCWYLGSTGQGANKCKETTFDADRFASAWSQVACARDSSFGCRRNFLIILGDGEDNVRGQDANGAVGNLQNSASMLTWALNLGDPKGCNSGGGLHSIVRAGGGECINVQTQERLRQVLESLIGQFRTTARSFASAAVPSVQATVEQKIFLTSFLPFNDSPVWKGSVHAFVKPLPITGAGVPLTEQKCDGTGSLPPVRPPVAAGQPDPGSQQCHLWDGGEIVLTQYPDSGTDYLALDDTERRRVFYALQAADEGDWARNMRLFDPIAFDAPNSREERFDLWRGMGLAFSDQQAEIADATVNRSVANSANGVVDYVLRMKSGTELDTITDPPTATPHHFLIGDIFHSTPVVIGTPSNTAYFAGDLYGNTNECDPAVGTASANPGYRCFFQKQRFRRKMLLLGSNDGMLHAFDAGMFRTGGEDHWTGADLVDPQSSPFGSFDNGTGKELFGFVPRSVLPALRSLSTSTEHRYTVDGTVTVADVFVDPLRETAAAAFPVAAQREWRTVVIGGLREGGRGYYALDITQPDPVTADDDLGFLPTTADDGGDNDPSDADYVPECTAGLAADGLGVVTPPAGAGGCGPVPFPAVLWEFTDTYFDPATKITWFADEESTSLQDPDGTTRFEAAPNGRPDLADTWSTPSVGRIRLCKLGGTACDPTPDDADLTEDDDLVDVFVAVVGGGMDPQTKQHDWRQGPPLQDGVRIDTGNWLYIVDIETGEPIYKRELQGAVPSEPAAVDTDGDGYLDRIYIGTLGGFLYRIDLDAIEEDGDDVLPALTLQPVTFSRRVGNGSEPLLVPQLRPRIPRDVFPAVKLFDSNFDGATALAARTPPRGMYQRPSVIFQAGSGKYVLAFGTGDRDDLWNILEGAPQERFYVFVDPFDSTAAISTPMNESSLVPISPDVTATTTANLLDNNGGWVMQLAPKERVITDAFALSGVTVFSTFVPRTEDGLGNETVVGCRDGQIIEGESSKTCAKQGLSHVFVVNTTNANGLLFEGDTDVTSRYKVAPTFVTNPFAEPGQTQNTGSINEGDEHTADDLSPNMLRVMETLQGLFPPQCKFANYRIDIKTVAADTSLQFIAPVPVCLIESNWKEF